VISTGFATACLLVLRNIDVASRGAFLIHSRLDLTGVFSHHSLHLSFYSCTYYTFPLAKRLHYRNLPRLYPFSLHTLLRSVAQ
jgi:hypothetical protein